MSYQSFSDYLAQEAITERVALVSLYEVRDKLLYAEAPPLRQRYMSAIGKYEEPVLESELELSMLGRKAELIQAAINRREAIDLNAIDARIAEERERTLGELEAGDRTLDEFPVLSKKDGETLQQLYHEITHSYHPALNPSLSSTQRELYDRAQKAYRMRDLDALRLIHDMLFGPIVELSANISSDDEETEEEEEARHKEDIHDIATYFATDYTLAKRLYDCFVPLQDDAVFLDTLKSCREQRAALESEIAEIRASFPFSAKDTLESAQKTEEYLAELRMRTHRCEEQKQDLETRIAAMLEEAANE